MNGRDRKALTEAIAMAIILLALALLAFLCVKTTQKDAEPKMAPQTASAVSAVDMGVPQELASQQVTFSCF